LSPSFEGHLVLIIYFDRGNPVPSGSGGQSWRPPRRPPSTTTGLPHPGPTLVGGLAGTARAQKTIRQSQSPQTPPSVPFARRTRRRKREEVERGRTVWTPPQQQQSPRPQLSSTTITARWVPCARVAQRDRLRLCQPVPMSGHSIKTLLSNLSLAFRPHPTILLNQGSTREKVTAITPYSLLLTPFSFLLSPNS
jgi:hypothetical protein